MLSRCCIKTYNEVQDATVNVDCVAREVTRPRPSTNSDDATASASVPASRPRLRPVQCSRAAGQPATLVEVNALLDLFFEVAAESFQDDPHLLLKNFAFSTGRLLQLSRNGF